MDKITRRKIITAAAVAAGSSLVKPFSFGFAQTQAEKPFTIGINAMPPSLDPHFNPVSIVGYRTYNFFNDQLTQIDNSGRTVPMLATGWRGDGVTWRFTLRQGVKLHDGSTMTSEDVVYSLNRLITGTRPSPARASLAPFVSKIEADGRFAVVITTPQPDAALPMLLSSPYTAIVPAKASEALGFEKFQTAPLGAGPYKVADFVAGNRIVLERHDYWGGRPAASRVTIRLIPENATRFAALQSGEVDFVTTVTPDVAPSLEQAAGLKVMNIQLFNATAIFMMTRKGLTANPEMRRALSLAIDRETIAKALWSGRVRVMNDYFFPGELGYNSSRPKFRFNLNEAKAALKRANYNGEPLAFTPPGNYYTNGRVVQDAIAEMWKNLGVNVEYSVMEFGAWSPKFLGGEIVSTMGSYDTKGDPATNVLVQSFSNGSWLEQYYQNPEFKTLAAQGRSSTDRASRLGNYRQIAAVMDRDTYAAPLYQSVEFYGMREGITFRPHPYFFVDLRPRSFSF